jgi:NTE family protein
MWARARLWRWIMLNADLVLEGGGTKGVALIGAVAHLRKRYRIRRVAGSSVGAIVAAFVAAGWSGERLKKEMLALPFGRIPQASLVDRVWVVGPLLSWSISRGVYATDFIRDYIADKLDQSHIVTFGDLRDVDEGSSLPMEQRYKLVVTASDVTTGELLHLPWDYPRLGLDPDQQFVADAVVASMSIPLYFEPHNLVDGNGDTHVLVDGGLLSNFPITIFDRTDGTGPRWPTFGVKIIPRLPEDAAELFPWFGKVPHPGIRQLEAVVATAIVGNDQTALGRPDVDVRTFTIDTSAVGLVDFRMSEEAKLDAFHDGWIAAGEFLDGWDWDAYRAKFRPEAGLATARELQVV